MAITLFTVKKIALAFAALAMAASAAPDCQEHQWWNGGMSVCMPCYCTNSDWYLPKLCDGTDTSQPMCVASCDPGQYVYTKGQSQTNGTLPFKACTNDCPFGYYKNTKTLTCDMCPDKCKKGYYLDGECDGTTTTPAVCKECRCPKGMWPPKGLMCDGDFEDMICLNCTPQAGCKKGRSSSACVGSGKILGCNRCKKGYKRNSGICKKKKKTKK